MGARRAAEGPGQDLGYLHLTFGGLGVRLQRQGPNTEGLERAPETTSRRTITSWDLAIGFWYSHGCQESCRRARPGRSRREASSISWAGTWRLSWCLRLFPRRSSTAMRTRPSSCANDLLLPRVVGHVDILTSCWQVGWVDYRWPLVPQALPWRLLKSFRTAMGYWPVCCTQDLLVRQLCVCNDAQAMMPRPCVDLASRSPDASVNRPDLDH